MYHGSLSVYYTHFGRHSLCARDAKSSCNLYVAMRWNEMNGRFGNVSTSTTSYAVYTLNPGCVCVFFCVASVLFFRDSASCRCHHIHIFLFRIGFIFFPILAPMFYVYIPFALFTVMMRWLNFISIIFFPFAVLHFQLFSFWFLCVFEKGDSNCFRHSRQVSISFIQSKYFFTLYIIHVHFVVVVGAATQLHLPHFYKFNGKVLKPTRSWARCNTIQKRCDFFAVNKRSQALIVRFQCFSHTLVKKNVWLWPFIFKISRYELNISNNYLNVYCERGKESKAKEEEEEEEKYCGKLLKFNANGNS